MMRLITPFILCAVAFVAGVIYERNNIKEACEVLGGLATNGLCLVEDKLQ